MSFLRDDRRARPGYLHVIDCDGRWITLSDGRKILDGSGGAGVACIGAKDERVLKAFEEQFRDGPLYVPSLDFTTNAHTGLEAWLCFSTNNDFAHMFAYGSGSESVEAALKLAIQYYQALSRDPMDPKRNIFIARHQSYHGATFAALDVSGHRGRRAPYLDVLPDNTKFVSPCYYWRDNNGNSSAAYVEQLRKEFIETIEKAGSERVAGFIMEPVVGAALGCVAATEGYMQAMQEVCREYGILFIADEIMCGLGRTGSYHAYTQHEGVKPDILLLGKGLAGGYTPISAMLVSEKITEVLQLKSRSARFNHGHTFQNHAGACIQALAVQSVIVEENLIENVRFRGAQLENMLRTRLGKHKYVGDIRGVGLFWALEFVKDRDTKVPFNANRNIAMGLHKLGLQPGHEIYTYPGTGSVDGKAGDHMMLAPAYNVTTEELEMIVDRVVKLVTTFFENEDNSTDLFTV